MAILLQFISQPVDDETVMASIRRETTSFMDLTFFATHRGTPVGSAFVTAGRRAVPTDALIHICSKGADQALSLGTAADPTHVGGMTSVEVVDDPPGRFAFSGYSEVWLHRLLANYSVPLRRDSSAEVLRDVGTLIAVAALHELMHLKVEPREQVRRPHWDLHVDGGGGVASPNGGLVRTDSRIRAAVSAENARLIRAHLDQPVEQTQRVT